MPCDRKHMLVEHIKICEEAKGTPQKESKPDVSAAFDGGFVLFFGLHLRGYVLLLFGI